MSSGVPSLPVGLAAGQALLHVHGHVGRRRRGQDEARRDGVGADAVAAVADGQVAGQLVEGGLGDAVRHPGRTRRWCSSPTRWSRWTPPPRAAMCGMAGRASSSAPRVTISITRSHTPRSTPTASVSRRGWLHAALWSTASIAAERARRRSSTKEATDCLVAHVAASRTWPARLRRAGPRQPTRHPRGPRRRRPRQLPRRPVAAPWRGRCRRRHRSPAPPCRRAGPCPLRPPGPTLVVPARPHRRARGSWRHRRTWPCGTSALHAAARIGASGGRMAASCRARPPQLRVRRRVGVHGTDRDRG